MMAREKKKPKTLPGRLGVCKVCRARIVWAVTSAGPNGRGGKPMPLDAVPNDAGNVAVRAHMAGRLVARVLGKDETHDPLLEQLAMPHFATCGKDLVPEIEAFLADAAEEDPHG